MPRISPPTSVLTKRRSQTTCRTWWSTASRSTRAKQSLRRKYGGGSSGGGGAPSAKDIAEITTDDGNVTVTSVVLTAGERSIRYQGSDHVIVEGRLADETGVIDYTAWEDFGLSPGDTITTAGNAGVREWDGEPELNLGESTSLSFIEESLEVPYERAVATRNWPNCGPVTARSPSRSASSSASERRSMAATARRTS